MNVDTEIEAYGEIFLEANVDNYNIIYIFLQEQGSQIKSGLALLGGKKARAVRREIFLCQ